MPARKSLERVAPPKSSLRKDAPLANEVSGVPSALSLEITKSKLPVENWNLPSLDVPTMILLSGEISRDWVPPKPAPLTGTESFWRREPPKVVSKVQSVL